MSRTQVPQLSRLKPASDEHQIIVDWLSSLNFKVTQRDIFEQRTEGTGQWLLDSQEFKGWIVGNSKTLWCHGIREMSHTQKWVLISNPPVG